jgi:Icc-related predicted phosphoesterase
MAGRFSLRRQRDGDAALRVFFATDIHGSETCWRKFLHAAEFYGVDVLVLGGDMTGKGMVAIVAHPDGRYTLDLQGERHEADSAEALRRCQALVRERGLYPFVATPEELAELREDDAALDALFARQIRETVERWVTIAEERLDPGVRCFVCPGNDDDRDIDDLLAQSERLQLGEGCALDVAHGYQVVSTGWTNPTPWDTHREEPEEALARRIAAAFEGATAPPERILCNFHCPPHGTSLDEAPALDEQLRMVAGGRSIAHVGSTAVRDALDRVQPLLALHGHVHESRAATRLGRTLILNPGSSYEMGVLQGAVVTIDGPDRLRYQLTAG